MAEIIKKTYNVEVTDTCLKILSGKEQGEIVRELMSSVNVLKNLMNKKEQNHDKA